MTGEEAGARQANPAQDEASGEPNRSWESAEKVRKWVRWVIECQLFDDDRWRRTDGRRKRDDSAAVAARAQLRHGVGKEVGAVPSIWAYTLESQRPQLSDQKPSWGENAVHTALTLWARHQGSNAAPMHKAEGEKTPRSFGGAVRALAEKGRGDKRPEETPVYRRLSSVVAAQTFGALAHHLRGIVDLLEAAEIPMDYGLLAADLFEWQSPPRRGAVTRRWGRQFARAPIPAESAEDEASE